MAQIQVTVNGKTYPLACAAGEEERLRTLAEYVDNKMTDLSAKLGHVAETRLLLMAAILIADELQDALEGAGADGILGGYSGEDLAMILHEVASEVEGIADRIQE
ncbi:cell division protein ZapA [Kordiimonas sediminis]|uniref:Cell division protein ZapA n=1 Tax=Kordiimonas sediminis TaxID=1735581 RepID=A0A919ARY7_9PROT|nr:cell division protein ZapA [Kordiimonas sediminis]GHF20055.1 cell division protein ZapA [Kordiimonas sediminis]